MRTLRLANSTVPAGNTVGNTTTKTLFADVYPYPANTYTQNSNIGRSFEFKAYVKLSTMSGTPGTLSYNIELGGVILGTMTFTLPAGLSGATVKIEATAIIAATGSGTSGLISCQGQAVLDNAGTPISASVANAGSLQTGYVALNTQSAGDMGISAQFSVANAGNTTTLELLTINEDR